MSENHVFEPGILAFCCHHCAYVAADLAGAMRLTYPPNLRIVRIPCSGKLDVIQTLGAFERGLDGVMVAGWLEGDCHYLEGNLVAKKRVKYIQRILNAIGMESDRITMVNLSSAMGAQFAQVATEMTERIRKLGPNPLRNSRQAGTPDVPHASE